MQTITITHRPARIWWFAAKIWALATAVFAVLIAQGVLFFNNRLDAWDWSVLGAVPACLAAAWIAYVWFTGGSRARRLTADETGVTIERLDGQIISLRWSEIRALDYNSLEEEILTLRTADTGIAVLGHEFEPQDWSAWVEIVIDRVGDQVEFCDTQVGFDRSVTRWLDRTSLGFALLGGAAVVGLAVWDIRNAAAWIVLVGVLGVLVYLGHCANGFAEARIPTAGVIGFFAAKLAAIVPLALLVVGMLRPAAVQFAPHKHALLYYVSNAMFFGGIAAALILKGGFSPQQHFDSNLRGANRLCRRVSIAALATCVLGFALKVWNEG